MSKSDSPGENNHLPAEGPVTSFLMLDGKSEVPSVFRSPNTFTITRLRSPVGLPDRITKRSVAPALLVSVSLKALPRSGYQLWTEDKIVPTAAVDPFRSNVIDFASAPRCWTGCAFDYLHYSVPHEGLDDIALDLGVGIGRTIVSLSSKTTWLLPRSPKAFFRSWAAATVHRCWH